MNIEYLLITKLFKGKIWQLLRYYRILLSKICLLYTSDAADE